MTIEFTCPQCGQSLRVPEEVAGRNGKCPQCATIFVVPAASTVVRPPTGPAKMEGTAPQRNPFADETGVNPFDVGGVPAARYPPAGFQQFGSEQPVLPQSVEVGAVISLASPLWQRHLGMLLLTHLILLVIAFLLGVGRLLVLSSAYEYEPFGEFDSGLSYYLATSGMTLFSCLVLGYFWIGQVQFCLKLARNQPADFADLFLAGERFFPTAVAVLLISLPFWILDLIVTLVAHEGFAFGGFEAGFATGYAILYFLAAAVCVIFLWPVPYLVLDRKATVLQSYGTAFRITQLNIGTSILLALITIACFILGYCACLVGLLFSLPFVTLLWSTAYLMLAGQIPAYNWLAERSKVF